MRHFIYLTRRERFNAAHRLFKPDFTDLENEAFFGKCSNPNWHGHNYVLFVTVKGYVNHETGLLINLKELSHLINTHVVEKIDHKNMNVEVDFMKGKYSSSENLAISIWEVLKEPVKKLGAEMHKVKIEETENNFVEYFGDSM
ncbi:MAG: 6-carboxytetrahydropterin synthase [Bacteroidales bacterium]|nr:6-carboxytetrahydropterin synthase [Bacteroidales bacterium]